MKHRIRAAGLVLDPDQRILLVRETDPVTGVEFWVPPGGGLEPQDSSVIECLRREFQEETGLIIEVGRLVYLREFVETSRQVSLPEQAIAFRNKLEVLGYEVAWDYLLGYTHVSEMKAIKDGQETVTQAIVQYITTHVRKMLYLPLILNQFTE